MTDIPLEPGVPAPRPTIIAALAAVMTDVAAVGKGDRNDFHGFAFRGIDRVLNAVGPALRTHHVIVVPKLLALDSRDTNTDKGKVQREVTVTVRYRFHGPAGDRLTCVVPGEAADIGDKAVSKAMSVAFRTALIQALAIPTDEPDPDAGQMPGRGTDKILQAKRLVWSIVATQGHDMAWLTADFHSWSQGQDIELADSETLNQYAKHLQPEPTRRVSRT